MMKRRTWVLTALGLLPCTLAVLVHSPSTPLPSTLTSFDPFGATDAGAE